MRCNKPVRALGHPKKKFKVKACTRNKTKVIYYGDKNMHIKKHIPARRKSFRARHQCDTDPPNKLSARYWSCKKW